MEDGMYSKYLRRTFMFAAVLAFASVIACRQAQAGNALPFPSPALDEHLAKAPGQETAVFSGGCFWGVQAVFKHVKGVISATSGYAGGEASTAHYEMVSEGNTGHAESVRVVYDPSRISYGDLLKIF